jgi:protocatechuate 4,5-dioxygenase alpha chain
MAGETLSLPRTMSKEPEEYEDIPGTVVFDAERARIGYHLNEFLYSLMKSESRAEFLADERKYLMKFAMTDEQREAVMKRAWNRLLELGGVSYALAKLAFTDKKSYQFMASQMVGIPESEYVKMMVSGGRSPDGWRSKSERKG